MYTTRHFAIVLALVMIPEAQVANITEDIRNGNTGYLNDFLNAVISEGIREGVTDICGEGVEN